MRASGLSGPPAAQRAIELDDRCQLLPLQRGEIELASKETALRIEHREIAVETSLVPVGRQPGRIAQRRHELLLLCALRARLVIPGERLTFCLNLSPVSGVWCSYGSLQA